MYKRYEYIYMIYIHIYHTYLVWHFILLQYQKPNNIICAATAAELKSYGASDTVPDSKVNGAHLGPTRPRWAPCLPHELYYLGSICSWHKSCIYDALEMSRNYINFAKCIICNFNIE